MTVTTHRPATASASASTVRPLHRRRAIPSPRTAHRGTLTTLVGALNLEWAGLRAAEASTWTVLGWGGAEPDLGAYRNLPDLDAGITAAGPELADRLLLAVLRRGQAGDDTTLAHRTVLQLMLGKAVRIARTQSFVADPADAEAATVTALLETIRGYRPGHHTPKVATTLALGTLQRVERTYRRPPAPHETLDSAEVEALPAAATEPTARRDLLDLLAWAAGTGVLTDQESGLLARVYEDGGPGGQQIAADLGVSWPALRQRCSRSVRRLAAAAAVYPDRP